ncbi:diguanylate cyclase domain-containing protein [Dactylosporangium sp. CA-233914]|uniref:diguanylate cyclase domain-containing protein n=1 Tax=Dactylosporangium sp. CA-233914 TaxID=3239934 RepID=UPI003D8A4223
MDSGWGDGLVIGVLSPFVGGTYYGRLVAGVTAAGASRGVRTIAVQALDAAADVTVTGGNPAFDEPVAWRHAAGFVVLAEAVTPTYLVRLIAAGKPVVLIGHEVPEVACPSVLPDNGAGIRQIMAHLAGHGHRRIAFTGYLAATDVAERYHAYRSAVAALGLDDDPALFLTATDNLEGGITWTADEWRRLGADALVAATDRNAIGAQQVLSAAGLACPDDYALTGFDNIEVAAFLRPELTSAAQPLDAMGDRAVELLLRALSGEAVAPGPHRLPAVLVPRASCGCTDFATALPPSGTAGARERLAERLGATLPPTGIRPAGADALAERAVAATVEALTAAATGGPVGITALAGAVGELFALHPAPEILRLIFRAIQEYAQTLPDLDVPGARRVGECVQELMMVLGRAENRAQFADRRHLRSLISTQYALNTALLYTRDTDPRDPSWLAATPASAAAIALRGPDGELARTPGWRRTPGPPIPSGPTTVERFPPAELIAAAEPGQTIFLVPARTNGSDHGWLALVDTVECEVEDGRELPNQCAALLTVALDLREQEERLRRSALSDRLTTLPNRTSFLATLDSAVHAAAGGGEPFALLFLDLDGFKRVNDTLGHAAGDQLLVRVAQRIRACLRPSDVPARFGGDEFLVLLPGVTDGPVLAAITARLTAAIRAPFHLEAATVEIGVSIGATTSSRHPTAEQLLHEADAAMYRVKGAR